VALLLVGRSAFPWLLLSHTAWTSKESEAAAAVEVSIAICRYGSCSSAGLGRLMGDGGGSGGAASLGGECQTARRDLFVLIFVLHVSCLFF